MHFNTNSSILTELSVELGESVLLDTGAIVTTTGQYRGRAATAKAYVRDELTESTIDWEANNSISEEQFATELNSFREYAKAVHPLFCQEVRAVRDEKNSLDVVVYTETAKHSLFARNMFIPDVGPRFRQNGSPFVVYHFPNKESEAKVLISMKSKTILITGTHYSGEIKKSVFSVLNFLFPEKNHLPMHCSVNVDRNRENAAIFFGLSGTGKTTLSSDENRVLIGDDEHGWTDEGITNFEGGCYAKTIDLSEEAEPQIWKACNSPGAILENVVVKEGVPDFSDDSLTQNTRGSYPCSSIPNSDIRGYVDQHPKNVIMLTCDAFGVLPAVMKLSPDEAVKQFLLGYTAKVAGTEAGVTEPEATFSACFGAPFMPLPPSRYAEILRGKLLAHNTDCWLVNTGWTGGGYGTGSRMPIKATRLIIDKIHDGSLAECETFIHKPTGFTVPLCGEIPSELLTPEAGWQDPVAYQASATHLMSLFRDQEKNLG